MVDFYSIRQKAQKEAAKRNTSGSQLAARAAGLQVSFVFFFLFFRMQQQQEMLNNNIYDA